MRDAVNRGAILKGCGYQRGDIEGMRLSEGWNLRDVVNGGAVLEWTVSQISNPGHLSGPS